MRDSGCSCHVRWVHDFLRLDPCRWLFLDLNAYFASVEQQENPELRGKPIIVAPGGHETTVAIAASYEAKARGVNTLDAGLGSAGALPGHHRRQSAA